jgi:hypothetical protein
MRCCPAPPLPKVIDCFLCFMLFSLPVPGSNWEDSADRFLCSSSIEILLVAASLFMSQTEEISIHGRNVFLFFITVNLD